MKVSINVENVSKVFEKKTILNNINFSLSSNCDSNYVCLCGASGCGKTTLLNIVCGLCPTTSGLVSFIVERGDTILSWQDMADDTGILLQNEIAYMPCGNALLNALSVKDNILLVNKLPMEEILKIADILAISDILHKYPHQISSGEYKRALFARTLSQDATFLVMDEPTSNLDRDSANRIALLIDYYVNRQDAKRKGVLIATHDKALMKGKVIQLG